MTPLFKKLNFKNHSHILVCNEPGSFDPELEAMSGSVHIVKDEKELDEIEFAIVFVTKQQEIEFFITTLYPKLKGDAVLWFCYPKGTSKRYKCDFNRDNGWNALGKYNMEGVRMVAIDKDWRALRFRKTEYIKTLKRDFAMSEEGKKRTGKI